MKVSARARVLVTIEITVADTWGGDCPTSQIHKQAADSARDELRQVSLDRSGYQFGPRNNWMIIGTPKVETVLVDVAEPPSQQLQRGDVRPEVKV